MTPSYHPKLVVLGINQWFWMVLDGFGVPQILRSHIDVGPKIQQQFLTMLLGFYICLSIYLPTYLSIYIIIYC